eukprot:TRINITY_DN1964_c0_g1_i1.p1 TRINITY_DN1964_c0_g1~~TRINITY_DN1964_c0_g1_i1.p1  ORF type:complete len:256 (-),score=52.83 TRINITY_DN1964_c0_g1_i1:45-812(-)
MMLWREISSTSSLYKHLSSQSSSRDTLFRNFAAAKNSSKKPSAELKTPARSDTKTKKIADVLPKKKKAVVSPIAVVTDAIKETKAAAAPRKSSKTLVSNSEDKKLRSLTKDLERLQKSHEEHLKRIQELTAEKESLMNDLAARNAQLEDSKQELKGMQSQLRAVRESKHEEVDQTKNSHQALREENAELHSKLKNLESHIRNLEQHIASQMSTKEGSTDLVRTSTSPPSVKDLSSQLLTVVVENSRQWIKSLQKP